MSGMHVIRRYIDWINNKYCECSVLKLSLLSCIFLSCIPPVLYLSCTASLPSCVLVPPVPDPSCLAYLLLFQIPPALLPSNPVSLMSCIPVYCPCLTPVLHMYIRSFPLYILPPLVLPSLFLPLPAPYPPVLPSLCPTSDLSSYLFLVLPYLCPALLSCMSWLPPDLQYLLLSSLPISRKYINENFWRKIFAKSLEAELLRKVLKQK